jgi:hypothetical protein
MKRFLTIASLALLSAFLARPVSACPPVVGHFGFNSFSYAAAPVCPMPAFVPSFDPGFSYSAGFSSFAYPSVGFRSFSAYPAFGFNAGFNSFGYGVGFRRGFVGVGVNPFVSVNVGGRAFRGRTVVRFR